MKTLARFLGLLVLAVTIAIPVSTFTGCARTVTQERKTFNSLYTLGASVDTSYKAYIDLVIAKQLPTNAVPAVSRDYANFQATFTAALVITEGNKDALAPASVEAAAGQFNATLSAAKQPTFKP